VLNEEQEQGDQQADSLAPALPAQAPVVQGEDDVAELQRKYRERVAQRQQEAAAQPERTQEEADLADPRKRMTAWFNDARQLVKKVPSAVDKALTASDNFFDKLPATVGRGLMEGVDKVANNAVGLGIVAEHKAGLQKVLLDKNQQSDFEDWYEHTSFNDLNPYKFGDDRRERWLGKDEHGVLGFLQDGISTAVGFAAAGELLEPFGIGAGVTGGLEKAGLAAGVPGKVALAVANIGGHVVENSIKGAMVDMAMFDQHHDRISNWLENSPHWISNPVTRYLSNKADDSELESRFKGALEGIVTNNAIEGLVFMVKGFKVSSLWKAGDITNEEGLSRLASYQAKLKGRQLAKERYTTAPLLEADGQWHGDYTILDKERGNMPVPASGGGVTKFSIAQSDNGLNKALDRAEAAAAEANTMAKTPSPPPTEPRLKSEIDAESFAAAENWRIRNMEWTEADAREGIAVMRKLAEENMQGDTRDFEIQLERTGLNMKWDHTPEEVVAIQKAVVESSPKLMERLKAENKRNWSETSAKASENIGPDVKIQHTIARAKQVFGETANLDASIDEFRTMLEEQAHNVQKLNKAALANEDNATAWRSLHEAYDAFLNLHGWLTGSKSQIARAMRVMAKGVGDNTTAEAIEKDFSTNVLGEAGHVDPARVDPKVKEIVSALDEVREAQSTHATAVANKDTETISASEVQMSRVWDKWKHLLGDEDQKAGRAIIDPASPEGQQHRLELAAGLEDKARSAKNAGLTVNSGSPEAGPGGPKNPIMDLASLMTESENKLTKELETARKNARKAAAESEKSKFAPKPAQELEKVNPVDQFKKGETMQGAKKVAPPQGPRTADDVGIQQGPQRLQGTAPGFGVMPENRAPAEFASAEGLTRQEIIARARMIAVADDPTEMLLQLHAPIRPRTEKVPDPLWKRILFTYRINSMLSGGRTSATNMLNNTIMSAQLPLEKYFTGAVHSLNPLNAKSRAMGSEMRQEGWDTMVGLLHGYKEAWRMSRKAISLGENILDQARPEIASQLTKDAVKEGESAAMSQIKGVLSGTVHAPTTFMMGTDEFYQVLNYRANVRAQSLRQMRAENITDPKEIAKRLVEDLQASTDNIHGDGLGRALNPKALKYSREATFKTHLEKGTLGADINAFAEKHPVFRFLVPFVPTQVNILDNVAQRTPILARFTREYQAAMASGDAERIALAQGRQALGAMAIGSAAALALSGQISGRGPADPKIRRQMKDLGWQEYSIKVPGTNKWISYRHMDPTFAHFGWMADIVQMSADVKDHDLATLIFAATASVAANANSKGFTQGLTEAMDAAASADENKVRKFFQNAALTFVPNILRQSDPNPQIMETRGFIDEFMARVPGWSDNLEPHRNVLGEPVLRPPGYFNASVNPLTYRPGVPDDDVMMHLTKLAQRVGGTAFTMPSQYLEGSERSVNLTNRTLYDEEGKHKGQSPYDRMQQLLLPKSEGGEFDLRGRLEKLMTPEFRKQPEGVQYQLAVDMIHDVQGMASAKMLSEYTKVQGGSVQAADYTAKKAVAGEKDAKKYVMDKYQKQLLIEP
jgi:hypothetical protein